MPIGGPFLRQGTRLVRSHIFQPLCGFLRSAGPDIHGYIGLGADLLREVQELVCAEGIGLDDAAPIWIEGRRALVGRPDSLAPMIFVGKAAAGPANHRYLQLLERGHDVVANSPRVRNGRAGTHPDAFVDSAAQMLGKLTENVAIDLRACFVGSDPQANDVIVLTPRDMYRGDNDDEQKRANSRHVSPESD